jgi:Zn-dependent peptidase ImmA (M78 family)
MRPRYALARRKAEQLLREAGIVAPPVPVEHLAERMGALVRYAPFDGQMSGLLHRSENGNRVVIGVNSRHPTVRQRFSIAHELGHLALHEPAFQIDQHAFVSFRNSKSSTASDPHEIEANQFAAALLMPESLLRTCVDQLGENPDVEESIRRLAQRFDVSTQAMTIRLTSLGEITPTFG